MDQSMKSTNEGPDPAATAAAAIQDPALFLELIEGIKAPAGTARYACEKSLRIISESRPELLYPYFDVFAELLDHKNSFLKWGGIVIIANLTPVDVDRRFDRLFRKYYAPIRGPVMITAANIIGASAKIAACRPDLAGRIAREILKVETAEYIHGNKPSPECRRVAIGAAISTFSQIYDLVPDRKRVREFVRRQLTNPRKSVAKAAAGFMKKHSASA